MDKNSIRSNQTSSVGLVSDSKKNQDVSGKQWPRNSRRRESPNFSNTKSEPLRNSKSNQATKKGYNFNDKRPRPRNAFDAKNSFDIAAASSSGLENPDHQLEAEVNSVFLPGSKKQNWNQLLNFNYVPRDREPQSYSRNGHNRGYVKKTKYNKEHFLRANCQFVVKAAGDYSSFLKSPDALVEWGQIEQIIIQSSEEPQCPICLFPPIAAKMTKCGHIYCWPCILHYLALSDKSWRKCPICYDAVSINDLKSSILKPFNVFNINDTVTFQLMRREKNCLNVSKAKMKLIEYKVPHLTDNSDDTIHSKLLLANDNEILSIVDRERGELNSQLSGSEDCPENVFIHQALELLKTREQLLESILEEIAELNLNKLDENYKCASSISEISEIESIFNDDSLIEDLNHQLSPAIESEPFDWSQYYFFYQALDGQNIYLHSLNVRMLQAMYGSLENAPPILKGRILQKECCSMSEELRKRLKYLQHLPISCQFDIVEIQLDSQLSNEIMDKFKDELMARKRSRQRRAREERIREKHIYNENERQLGKVLTQSANIDIESTAHFPSCGLFDASLSPPSFQDYMIGASPRSESGFPNLSSHSDATETASCPSFAKMLSNAPTSLWPTLDSPSSSSRGEHSATPNLTQVTGYKQQRIPARKTRNISLSDVEDDDCPRVPEFRSSFNSAIAEALERADRSNAKKSEANIAGGGHNETPVDKKKKKGKKTVLFSTGLAFRG